MEKIIENIFLSTDIQKDLKDFLSNLKIKKVFVLMDYNTEKYCFPKIKNAFLDEPKIFKIPPGEAYKNINTAIDVWRFLTKNGADRDSLLINLGGGVVSDIGGFVAATFKRGIRFLNLPTTLLAQIDAAIGGKTGINLDYLKNEIGSFYFPEAVIIAPEFLETLPERQLLSGFAEIIKHSLIDSEKAWNLIKRVPLDAISTDALISIIPHSVKVKMRYVLQDRYEKTGIRQVLNFGHTFAHALETLFHYKGIDLLHGEAVAIGIICETYLSNQIFILDYQKVFEISGYIATFYPTYKIPFKDYDELYEIMKHDKKNKDDKIVFTLLKDIGQPQIGVLANKSQIFEALNYYYQLA